MNQQVLYLISYGMYIVSSKKQNLLNGQIANTVFQITSDPKTIGISINRENLTHEFISQSKVFTLSILEQETPMPFIGTFGFKSGRDTDKFASTQYRLGENGAPIIMENALGYLECEVINQLEAGTHTLFVGKVTQGEILKEGIPLTYEYYHAVKQGKSPKTAPTYIKEQKEETTMKKYVCTVCGYIYDPEKGDPDGGIKPGTSFEAIPEDWVCPVCGVAKSEFVEVK